MYKDTSIFTQYNYFNTFYGKLDFVKTAVFRLAGHKVVTLCTNVKCQIVMQPLKHLTSTRDGMKARDVGGSGHWKPTLSLFTFYVKVTRTHWRCPRSRYSPNYSFTRNIKQARVSCYSTSTGPYPHSEHAKRYTLPLHLHPSN